MRDYFLVLADNPPWLRHVCMKAILEKYADPIADKIAQLGRDEWEKPDAIVDSSI